MHKRVHTLTAKGPLLLTHTHTHDTTKCGAEQVGHVVTLLIRTVKVAGSNLGRVYNILVCYVLLLSHSNKIHGEWVTSS